MVRPADRRGATVLSAFALVWAAAGTSALPSLAAWIALGAAVLATMTLIAAARRVPVASAEEPRSGWQRHFFRVAILQGIAIGAMIGVLAALDHRELIPAAVCAIVGLHLLPLAPLFEQPLYRWTAATLCLVAAVGFVVAASNSAIVVQGVVSVGAAIALYLTAASLLTPGLRSGR